MDLGTAIGAFIAHRRQANCAQGTLGLYGRQLGVWLGWLVSQGHSLVVPDIQIEDLRGFAAHLADGYVAYSSLVSSRKPTGRPLSENTRASYHRTLRAFWSFLATEELLTPEQQRFFSRIEAPRVPEDPRPSLDARAVKRLMIVCGDGSTEESARNRAIVLLLFETGMRISELCKLTDEVVDPTKRRARVLRAKGNKHRMVFWQPSGAAALARYLLMRRGMHGGPLFRGCSRRNDGGAVTPDLVRATLKRIAAASGVRLPYGAPLHAIRHGFAHAAIERGAQLTDLADLLGHADLETTRIYLRNDDDRLAAAYERIFSRRVVPSVGRGDAESHG